MVGVLTGKMALSEKKDFSWALIAKGLSGKRLKHFVY